MDEDEEGPYAVEFFDGASHNLFDWFKTEEEAKTEVRSLIEAGDESVADLYVWIYREDREITVHGYTLHQWLAGLV